LKTDSLISPGDQGDGFVLHGNLLFASMCGQRRLAILKKRPKRNHIPIICGTMFRLQWLN